LPKLSLTERLARALRQLECEDACPGDYPLSTEQTWARMGSMLQKQYRETARRLIRAVGTAAWTYDPGEDVEG
jgi:hypothetical protein